MAHSLLKTDEWKITGTTRDQEKMHALQERGIKTLLFDYNKPLTDPHLFFKDVTHILISTPPNDDGDPTFVMHGEDIRNLKSLKWIGYLSSTSVYGDRDGDIVNEESEIRPSSKRGSRRAIAEQQWLSLYAQSGTPVHIFRLAGIYGPSRSALDSVRVGVARRIDKPGHAFNRIHVDDIAQVLLASMLNPAPGNAYNLADNVAAPSHEVISHACKLLNIEEPPLIPFDEADMAPIARSFYKDNKRVCNDKIKNELGIKLLYPDFKTGLEACLVHEQENEVQLLQE